MSTFEESDLAIFDHILSTYRSRSSTFGQTLLDTIIVKKKDEWFTLITRIQPKYKNEPETDSLEYDYGEIKIVRRSLSKDETKNIFENMKKGSLNIPNAPLIRIGGKFEKNHTISDLHPSSFKSLNLDWPSEVYQLKLDQNYRPNLHLEPLLAYEKPFFPSERELMRAWCNLDSESYTSYYHSIVIVLPKYYAKISKAQLRLNEFSSQIELRDISLSDVVGKIYFENYNTRDIYNNELLFDRPEINIRLDFEPEWISYYLISKTNELLDYRRVHISWDRYEGVEILPFSEDIEELIQRGEGKHIEFKETINAKDKIAETIVSFSNTDGGTLLIGVNDNGEIVGVTEDKIHERVANIITDSIEPPSVNFEINQHLIKGKNIYAIRVQPAEDKPYMYSGRVYVRRSKTNKIAGKHELDIFYKKDDHHLASFR